MNRVKYIHPRTGERHEIVVTQAARHKLHYPAKPYLRDADKLMRERGFVRANRKPLCG